MANRILMVFFAAVLVIFPPNLPQAQAAICGNLVALESKLADDYGEELFETALTSEGGVLGIYRTETGSTWTMVLVAPNGLACVIATGESWQSQIVGASA